MSPTPATSDSLVTTVFVILIPEQWLSWLSPRIGYESYQDIFDFEYHPDERQDETRQDN